MQTPKNNQMMTLVHRKVIPRVPEMPFGYWVRRHVCTKLPQNASSKLNIHEHTSVTIMEIMLTIGGTKVTQVTWLLSRLLQNCEAEIFKLAKVDWSRLKCSSCMTFNKYLNHTHADTHIQSCIAGTNDL